MFERNEELNKILGKIEIELEKRKVNIYERNPHDHEFESSAEDVEHSLLMSVMYSLFEKDILPAEKITLAETIYCVKSVLTLLESGGVNYDYRDNSSSSNLVKELEEYGIKSQACEKVFMTEIEGNDPDGYYPEDNYEYVIVTTPKDKEIKIKLLSFFFMYANDVDDFLYQIELEKAPLKTNSLKELIKYIIAN